jgi:hypothetical protein
MIMLERSGLVGGYCNAPGQQRLVVLEARCLGQCGEQRAQVLVGLDGVGLGGFNQRVQIGTGGRTADGVGEQPVAPADDEGPDRVLAGVIIDWKAPIIDEAHKLWPLLARNLRGQTTKH